MLPFDAIEIIDGYEPKFMAGSLFQLPADLGGQVKLKKYASFAQIGRHKIDYGYLCLTINGLDGATYRIPGLLPDDEAFPNKLRVNSALRIGAVEKYLASFFRHLSEEKSKHREELSYLLHDLRSISTTITASAEKARDESEAGTHPADLFKGLISTQYLLKLRLDSLDFSVNNAENLVETKIFPKVDRVCRSFMTIASKRKISIRYEGSSFSTANVVSGFEFVPYALLDNAVKYSPNNSTITIRHHETDNQITFSVTSIGPSIEKDEEDKVFFAKYRGRSAVNNGYTGTGSGLYTCKRTLEKCGGTISVIIGDSQIETSKGPCRDITFTVMLPMQTKHYA